MKTINVLSKKYKTDGNEERTAVERSSFEISDEAFNNLCNRNSRGFAETFAELTALVGSLAVLRGYERAEVEEIEVGNSSCDKLSVEAGR